jgi:hypothetical protein
MRMERPEDFQHSASALAHPTITEDPNLRPLTLFPYSLAAVCSFWRDILCSHPEFWTLVVLFVDFKPTPLAKASVFLKWSRRHHIDVFVTRRDERRPTFYPGLHEKCQVDASLHTLKPHLRRFFLILQRPVRFPFPTPSTPIHPRRFLVYGSNPRPLSDFALLHPSPPYTQRTREEAVEEEESSRPGEES